MDSKMLGLWFVLTGTLLMRVEAGKHWAILAAGSRDWINYRHQAAVAHAYQLLKHGGIREANIITMMYDDLAYHPNNRYPGKLFTDLSLKDVYQGVKIDYKGSDVTAAMFLRVLSGDATLRTAGKKVLESGPNDNVFIFLVGHGHTGSFEFYNDMLRAPQLQATLTTMNQQKRYKKMVIYIESCHSGSMLHLTLPNNTKIYGVTASRPDERSYGCFCRDPRFDTCLANEFSYNWVMDSMTHMICMRSLQQQYVKVKSLVLRSNVTQYGDMTFVSDKLSKYHARGNGLCNATGVISERMETRDFMSADEIHLMDLMHSAMHAKSVEERAKAQRRLRRGLELINLVKETVEEIVQEVHQNNQPSEHPTSAEQQLDCLSDVHDEYEITCFSVHQVPELSTELSKFQKLCESGYTKDAIIRAVRNTCN